MTTRLPVLAVACASVVAVSAWAWTRPSPEVVAAGTPPVATDVVSFTVTGTVVGPAEGRTVSIAHDDIAGFMPAMTMPFTMGAGVDVGALRPGDRVRFVLQVDAERSEAHSLVVTQRDARAAAARQGAPPASTARLRRGDVLSGFALRDQEGAVYTAEAFAGRYTVLTFVFTRCPLPDFCPLMVRRFKELQTAASGDAMIAEAMQLLAVTLDPAFDTPEVLHAYGTAMGADFGRWRFVTGPQHEIDALARAFAVYTERSGPALDHTLATALIGPDGRVIEIWRGNGWRADEVLTALRAALAS